MSILQKLTVRSQDDITRVWLNDHEVIGTLSTTIYTKARNVSRVVIDMVVDEVDFEGDVSVEESDKKKAVYSCPVCGFNVKCVLFAPPYFLPTDENLRPDKWGHYPYGNGELLEGAFTCPACDFKWRLGEGE